MSTFEQRTNIKLYYDVGNFKGNTFEQNINAVNKLYLGLGLKISDMPYIYVSESDNKTYLSANCFIIENEKKEKLKTINYPISFIYKVFYHNNFLFYVSPNNQLNLYKFDKDSLYIERKLLQNKENKINKLTPNIERLKIEKNKVGIIIEKLEKINENNNLKENYEILCDVLGKDLEIPLNVNYPKAFNTLQFKIKPPFYPQEVVCTIKQINYQIDETGMIRENIQLDKGVTTFKKGINFLTQYVDFKDKIDIKNTFKSPILFKNFEEEKIQPNKVIMCEIKSGFDVDELKKQLVERIEAMKYFMFNKGEKPVYYIGIVNFASYNVDKLKKYSEYDFEINEKIVIVAAIDYNYFGMDLSYEVSDGYLLYKKMENLENKIEKKFGDFEKKFEDFEKKFDKYFTNLTNEIRLLHPNHRFTYIISPEKDGSFKDEEKSNDI